MLFLVRSVLEFRCVWVGVVSVLQAADYTPTQTHRNSNTHRTKNNTTNLVIRQNSRTLLMMNILMSETCWAHKKWNKKSKWHQVGLLFFNYHNDAWPNKHKIQIYNIYKIEPTEYEGMRWTKQLYNQHTSFDLFFFNNYRHPVTKTFTPLHYTCRHFTSSHLNLTQLHFTTLSFGLIPFKFPTAPLHPTSLHFNSLHFIALLDDFRHTSIPFTSSRL